MLKPVRCEQILRSKILLPLASFIVDLFDEEKVEAQSLDQFDFERYTEIGALKKKNKEQEDTIKCR